MTSCSPGEIRWSQFIYSFGDDILISKWLYITGLYISIFSTELQDT